MRIELLEEKDIPLEIKISENHISNIKKCIKEYEYMDVIRTVVKKMDANLAEKLSREALVKLNINWDEDELDLLFMLMVITEKIERSIKKELELFIKNTSDKLKDGESASSRIHFARRISEITQHLFDSLAVGTRDVGEVSYKLFLIKKFSLSFCTNIMNGIIDSIIQIPGLNCELGSEKPH
jgi:hypothetical protein